MRNYYWVDQAATAGQMAVGGISQLSNIGSNFAYPNAYSNQAPAHGLSNLGRDPDSGQFIELKRGLDGIEGFNSDNLVRRAKFIRENKQRVFFIGNGGSAAIASHMSADWSKNGKLSALSLNDPAALTCFANDHGFVEVFTNQLKLHARAGDLLFAISSAGQSANIRTAAMWARDHGIYTVTLSGFSADNPLRALGNENVYVPSSSYGVVEIAHLACLHAVLDRLT